MAAKQQSAKGLPGKCRSTARKAKYQRYRDRAKGPISAARTLRRHLRECPGDHAAAMKFNELSREFPLLKLGSFQGNPPEWRNA